MSLVFSRLTTDLPGFSDGLQEFVRVRHAFPGRFALRNLIHDALGRVGINSNSLLVLLSKRLPTRLITFAKSPFEDCKAPNTLVTRLLMGCRIRISPVVSQAIRNILRIRSSDSTSCTVLYCCTVCIVPQEPFPYLMRTFRFASTPSSASTSGCAIVRPGTSLVYPHISAFCGHFSGLHGLAGHSRPRSLTTRRRREFSR